MRNQFFPMVLACTIFAAPATAFAGDDTLPSAPTPTIVLQPAAAPLNVFAPPAVSPVHMRAFSSVGVDVKAGIDGIGFDVATPLSNHFNLRAMASFFSVDTSFNTDGIQTDATLHLGNAGAALDWFPFAGGFHLSPGVWFYDNNHASGNSVVPGGQTFTLSNSTYTSSADDPVRGTSYLDFGASAAPTLTVGWGNLIPRSGRHFSFPVEVGFAVARQPAISYTLAGSACDQYGCMDVATDPEIQANLKQEQRDINSDLAPLRFFPILSAGVGYRF